MIRLGELKHPIVVQRTVETRDEMGGVVVSWGEVLRARARIEALTGREAEAARRLVAEATHLVVTPWRDGVGPKMRVVHGAKVLDIVHAYDAQPAHPRRELALLCVDRDARAA